MALSSFTNDQKEQVYKTRDALLRQIEETMQSYVECRSLRVFTRRAILELACPGA
jgi:hypothetical protein